MKIRLVRAQLLHSDRRKDVKLCSVFCCVPLCAAVCYSEDVAHRATSFEQHTHLTAQRFKTQTAFQVWTPESGTHYCTPDDGRASARNMLSQ
jgi:hypothetical protein